MEEGTIQDSKKNLFMAEFLGTLLFMTSIFYSSLFHTSTLTIAIGCGFGNFIANIAFGVFTGGHFNPAVTIGYYLFIQPEKRAHVYTLLILIVAQFLGGLGGGLLLYIVMGFNMPILIPQADNLLGSFINEIYFSFMLITILFCLKNKKHHYSGDFILNILTAAFTIIGVILYGGKLSGACYNPAVGFTISFWSSLSTGNHIYMRNLPLYFFAPTIGACLAGFLVNNFIDQRLENKSKNSLTNDIIKSLQNGLLTK